MKNNLKLSLVNFVFHVKLQEKVICQASSYLVKNRTVLVEKSSAESLTLYSANRALYYKCRLIDRKMHVR